MNNSFDPFRFLFCAVGGIIFLGLIILFLPVILIVLLIYLIFFRYTLLRKINQVKDSRFCRQYGNFGFSRNGGTRPPSSATQEDDNTIDAEYTVLNNESDKN